MHCTERDQDLLLLQHGELSSWNAFWVERHLRMCPHCQEKQNEFARTSQLVAGAIRQDGGLSAFVLRGPVAKLAPVTPGLFATTQKAYRPVFLAVITVIAVMIAGSMYAYKAMAIAPAAQLKAVPLTVFQAHSGVTAPAKDAQGNPTIFPYSTPDMHDDCEKN